MRIIKEGFLVEQGRRYPKARKPLEVWRLAVRNARWNSLNDVRRTFPSADAVTMASGRTATVFNIAGNHYRLIVALHYNREIAYTLRFLTHPEYDKNHWKREL